MKKEKPLWQMLAFDDLTIALAKMIGYAGIPMVDATEQVKPLGKRYGKEVVQTAADRIAKHDSATDMLRLTEEARKRCWMLLGPPPEHPQYFAFYPERRPKEEKPDPTEVPVPPTPKRRRKTT